MGGRGGVGEKLQEGGRRRGTRSVYIDKVKKKEETKRAVPKGRVERPAEQRRKRGEGGDRRKREKEGTQWKIWT